MSPLVPSAREDIVFDPSLTPQMRDAILIALAGPHARISRVSAGGEVVWLKRVERLSLRWRLQKGDARHALAAERAGLRLFAQLGIPVARLVAEGADFLATASAGPTLTELLGPATSKEECSRAFAAAGGALARCHQVGLVHGRPKIRDICWDGSAARFIDLERFNPNRRKPRAMVLDLLILLHSLLVEREEPGPAFDAAVQGWRQGAPQGALQRFEGVLPRLWPLVLLAGHVQRLRPKSREVLAIPRLYQLLSRQ